MLAIELDSFFLLGIIPGSVVHASQKLNVEYIFSTKRIKVDNPYVDKTTMDSINA